MNLPVAMIQAWGPWGWLGLFAVSSILLIACLEHMSGAGIEGTVLGTLVMPYCSGIGNLIFVFVAARSSVAGTEIMTNCLVNNVTNLTLLIGLPAILWGLDLRPPRAGGRRRGRDRARKAVESSVNRLSLLLTLTAVLFFSGAVWALGRDGRIDFGDGLVLIGLFLFWQTFHVFEVMKANVRQNKSLPWRLVLDFAVLMLGAYGTYLSIEGLVDWLSRASTGFLNPGNLGWLSGWLMVLPNAVLALYYAWQGRPEVVYSSQIGDGHICIPLCVGLYAVLKPIVMPAFFQTGILLLLASAAVHLVFVAGLGRLPALLGWVLCAAYGVFLYLGLAD